MGTAKGYTGQYSDTTGLDYYNARYYDPVAAVFLSGDSIQGNAQGMNPYDYVGGNPETHSDPTGNVVVCGDTCGGGGGSGGSGGGGGGGGSNNGGGGGGGGGGGTLYSAGPPAIAPPQLTGSDVPAVDPPQGILGPYGWVIALAAACPACIPIAVVGGIALFLLVPNQLANSDLTVPITVTTSNDPGALFTNQGVLAHYGIHLIPHDVTTLTTSTTSTATSGGGQKPPGGGRPPATGGDFCSFTPDTRVSTSQGEQSIGKLHVGDKVWAYNPKTHKMEL